MPNAAESKSAPSKVDPALLAEAKANPNALFPVIVRGTLPAGLAKKGEDNTTRVKHAQDVLSSSKEGARRTLSIVGGASGSLRGTQILALSKVPSIDRIVRDPRFTVSRTAADAAAAVSEAGILAVNPPGAWSALRVSGQGIRVAVIASGV